MVSHPKWQSFVVKHTPVAGIDEWDNRRARQRDQVLSCGNHNRSAIVGDIRRAALVLLEHIASLEVWLPSYILCCTPAN